MKSKFIGDVVNKAIEEASPKSLLMVSDYPQYDSSYVSKLLSSAVSKGRLVRLANGIYAKPLQTQYGMALPSMIQVAQAIADRDHVQILPVGETAENMFGLSEQVPMKVVFLTSGSGRPIHIGDRTLVFRRGVPRNFVYKDKHLAALCQALRSIGVKNLTEEQKRIVYDVMRHYKGDADARADIMQMPQGIKKCLLQILNDIEDEMD